jgi:hypothetical protein
MSVGSISTMELFVMSVCSSLVVFTLVSPQGHGDQVLPGSIVMCLVKVLDEGQLLG